MLHGIIHSVVSYFTSRQRIAGASLPDTRPLILFFFRILNPLKTREYEVIPVHQSVRDSDEADWVVFEIETWFDAFNRAILVVDVEKTCRAGVTGF